MPRPWVCPKNGRTAEHYFPNVLGKTFAVFSAFYSFLSNGHFCPLALYDKTQQGGYICDTPLYCATSNPYIFDRVGILLNPDLDSAAVNQRKIALSEINEGNFPSVAVPITKQPFFVTLVRTSEKRTRCFRPLNAVRNSGNEVIVGLVS